MVTARIFAKIPIGHHRHEPASLLSPMQLVQDLKPQPTVEWTLEAYSVSQS